MFTMVRSSGYAYLQLRKLRTAVNPAIVSAGEISACIKNSSLLSALK